MVRTQIYLTERQRAELMALSRVLGKKQSQLIREAIDRFLMEAGSARRQRALREAAGMWKDRKDLPDFRRLREEWDRN